MSATTQSILLDLAQLTFNFQLTLLNFGSTQPKLNAQPTPSTPTRPDALHRSTTYIYSLHHVYTVHRTSAYTRDLYLPHLCLSLSVTCHKLSISTSSGLYTL